MHQALTAKYRPTSFADVIGQERAVGIVSGMLKDKGIPPAMLICGPRATGKTTIARIIGRRLNCEKPKHAEPCGKCPSCKEVSHPDLMELNAASDRGIDTIRSLESRSKLMPSYSARVFIIDEIHAMTPQAFQASLKLFEEPVKSTYFLLVTTNPEKMPETILSRCSQLKLRPVLAKVLGPWLSDVAKQEGLKLDKAAARRIAQACGGHPREALNMLEQLLALRGHHGKGTDLDVLIKQVTEDAPRQLLNQFITALVECKVADCIKLTKHVDNPEWFLNDVVQALRGLLRVTIDPALAEPRYRSYAKLKCRTDEVLLMLRPFAAAYNQSKTYLVDAGVLLDAAIVESMPEED